MNGGRGFESLSGYHFRASPSGGAFLIFPERRDRFAPIKPSFFPDFSGLSPVFRVFEVLIKH